MDYFEFWFMLPIGIIIATIAMMSGLGGAIMFSPFFMIVLKLDPIIALALGLIIEFFGFGSGVIGYLRAKAIDFGIVKQLLPFTFISTIIGVLISQYLASYVLQSILVALLLYISFNFLFGGKKCEPLCGKKVKKINYNIKISNGVKLFSAIGGLLIGLISSGLGEINEYIFLRKLKIKVETASAISVFLVAMSAIIGVVFHIYIFIIEGKLGILNGLIPILIFTVPGVVIGGQLGVFLSKKIKLDIMEKFIGILLFILALLTINLILINLKIL